MREKFPDVSRPILAAAVSMTVLGGCAFSDYQRPTIERVGAGDGRIVFAADVFREAAPERVRFTDIWQREEYALFRGGGAQAEILYSTTTTPVFTVVLEYRLMVDDMVETWNLNRKHAKAWDESRKVEAPLGPFFYKPYRLVGADRACFGFATEWDHRGDDPDNRPSKVLFGYFCAKPGAPLSLDRMEDLIQTIGVRGVTERIRHADAARREGAARATDARTQADAALIAHGPSPSADRGNASFPFDLAEFFTEGGEGDKTK